MRRSFDSVQGLRRARDRTRRMTKRLLVRAESHSWDSAVSELGRVWLPAEPVGATRREIVRLVLGHATALIAIGAVIGVAGAFALSRLLEGRLYQVGAIDVSSALAILTLVVVAVLACRIPAFRATRVDPVVALRNESRRSAFLHPASGVRKPLVFNAPKHVNRAPILQPHDDLVVGDRYILDSRLDHRSYRLLRVVFLAARLRTRPRVRQMCEFGGAGVHPVPRRPRPFWDEEANASSFASPISRAAGICPSSSCVWVPSGRAVRTATHGHGRRVSYDALFRFQADSSGERRTRLAITPIKSDVPCGRMARLRGWRERVASLR